MCCTFTPSLMSTRAGKNAGHGKETASATESTATESTATESRSAFQFVRARQQGRERLLLPTCDCVRAAITVACCSNAAPHTLTRAQPLEMDAYALCLLLACTLHSHACAHCCASRPVPRAVCGGTRQADMAAWPGTPGGPKPVGQRAQQARCSLPACPLTWPTSHRCLASSTCGWAS